ncbi:MAG: CoB--CoM heterodisulfide reductase iron-sulfur subunit A family protein [Candidatus Lokiarchaeota archaeon]|nr:CoB--CoM heterodisulfide reductase iron-sulfur subunit A family protein [Candidatus Lokiarchaeota archaeon]
MSKFVEKVGAAMVIGGGVGGIQASLDLADAGFRVYLVEKSPSIGGRMAQLDKTFPTNDCSLCILAPKMVEVFRHPNIELLTYHEVTKVEGKAGNFEVTVLKKPRYVDETKCKGCGVCAMKCPAEKKFNIGDEFNMGLRNRGAIYIPFPQAVPPIYLIDPNYCLKITDDKCGACAKRCDAGAINYEMKPEYRKIRVGGIIVATGFEQFDPAKLPRYCYQAPNVVTGLEFERIMCASGPYQGHVLRPSDKKHPHKIAMVSCVGSRTTKEGVPYCSSVCCMYIAKECMITKEHAPDTEMVVFKSDVRSYGKGFYEFIQRAQKEYGVHYVDGRVSFIEEDPETQNLILYYEDMETGESKQYEADLVVLATALVPPEGLEELAKILEVDMDHRKFFTEISELSPCETNRKGVYICGYAQAPKDIPESVADASSAAGKVAEILAPVRGTLAKEMEFEKPEKEIKPEDEPRIGVMICHCGINIGATVNIDETVEYIKKLPNVVICEANLYSCSSDSQERIKEMIDKYDLNRFIVASCTPRTHEPLFALTCREGGLNPYLFELVNIRDQCSWVHMHEPELATKKAIDLIRMTIAKSRKLKPQQAGKISVIKKVLIIGGGVSGITAAIHSAKEGFDTFLIERQPELGGILKNLHKVFPANEDASELLEKLKNEIESLPNIKVFTNTSIKNVGGYVGNYKIDLLQGEQEHHIEIGGVVVATGGNELKPQGIYGYGTIPNVITQLDLEEKLKNNSLGNIKDVAFILCANARQDEGEFTYCSKVCCATSIKNAYLLKEIDPNMNVTVIYRDIQMAGKNSEEFYHEVRNNVLFTRYSLKNPPKVTEKNGRALIEFPNVLTGENAILEADLVVLATPMIPQNDAEQISQFMKVPVMRGIPPFFLEAHVKLRPLDFATDGVFLCGAAQWPKPVEECVSQATGAAARACAALAKGEITTHGITMVINENLCIGCGRCAEVCPYNAIERVMTEKEFENVKLVEEKSQIIQAMCKGCGTCSVECPVGAITARHFTTDQLNSMIESYLCEDIDLEKVRAALKEEVTND